MRAAKSTQTKCLFPVSLPLPSSLQRLIPTQWFQWYMIHGKSLSIKNESLNGHSFLKECPPYVRIEMTRSTRLVLYWYTSKMIKSLPLPEEALYFPSLQDISRQEDCHSKTFAAFSFQSSSTNNRILLKFGSYHFLRRTGKKAEVSHPSYMKRNPQAASSVPALRKVPLINSTTAGTPGRQQQGKSRQPRPDRLS